MMSLLIKLLNQRECAEALFAIEVSGSRQRGVVSQRFDCEQSGVTSSKAIRSRDGAGPSRRAHAANVAIEESRLAGLTGRPSREVRSLLAAAVEAAFRNR